MIKETQHIEFKPNFNEDVIETLVAFANAKGGKVFIGIDDKGIPVKNFIIGKESIQNWINEVKTKTQLQIIPDWEIVNYESTECVAFGVQEYPIKPIACRGKYFKRVNNANHLLSVTEVVNLHLQSINSSWDAYPDTIHTLDDISLEKVQNCIEMMQGKGMTIMDSPLSFLLKFNLLREDKPTNAAYLMFKNNHSIITTIELGRFQDNITIKDTARTQSDIIAQVGEVLEFVKKHINLEVAITGEAQNIQKWQYPLEAIREIVLNMIIHRDYRSSTDSVIKIFDNKIEFYNPGKLPDDITIEDLLSNNYKSIPRNKSVADFFKNLGLIEKYGSGIGRIIRYFQEANLPEPQFNNISGGFQVTVFFPENMEKHSAQTTEKFTEKFTENLKDILDLIDNNPTISFNELSEKIGISRRAIIKNTNRLKQFGLLERIGPDKGGYWKIIKYDGN
jgi:ATP-dependent DNA helicase RecG